MAGLLPSPPILAINRKTKKTEKAKPVNDSLRDFSYSKDALRNLSYSNGPLRNLSCSKDP